MIDLAPFCSKEVWRPRLAEPFSRGGFTWATDGHILIRVPLRAEVSEKPDAPDVERIMVCHDGAEFRPLPRVAWPKFPARVACETCSGRGTEHDCPHCNCTCVDCDGAGAREAKVTVAIDGQPFDAKLIRLIAGLEGVEIAARPMAEGASPFRFEGGAGAVMARRSAAVFHLGDIALLTENAALAASSDHRSLFTGH